MNNRERKFFRTPQTEKRRLKQLIRDLAPVSITQDLIRLGPESDGGYLIPDDLKGIEACFSPGVGHVSGFEEDCADLGMAVYLSDYSVSSPDVSNENFHFTKKNIGAFSSEEYMTADEWIQSSLPESRSDLLLQMDIEGGEYELLFSISDSAMRRCRIIVAEFHMLHMLWSRPFFRIASRAIEKILQHHSCVHIHPNNCCGSLERKGLEIPRVMEFTFLRKDRINKSSDPLSFPHPLDRDNTGKDSLPLPECWY